MSKETEPIRSRRELREQSARATGAGATPASPAAAVQPVPEAAVAPEVEPAPDTAPRGERESAIRARDRAALRAYKELVDPPAMNPLPSRRALRQAQLDAERAPITALNPVLTAAAIAASKAGPGASVPGVPSAPAAPPAAAPSAPAQPAKTEPSKTEPSKTEPSKTQPAKTEPAKTGSAKTEPSKTQPAKTEPAKVVPAKAEPAKVVPVKAEPAKTEPAKTGSAKAEPASTGGELPRRPRSGRRAATAAVPMVHAKPKPSAPVAQPGSPAAAPAKPSVQGPASAPEPVDGKNDGGLPATAVDHDPNYPPMPGLVPGGSYYPVTAGPPPAATPSEEELAVLAAQKAEAERTAILNQRAEARERLAQESAKSKRKTSDPAATNNLAMVTPLEFIEVPGSDRPVMRPPTTTHVPIVTRATPKQTPSRPRPAAARPAVDPKSAASEKTASSPSVPSVSAERFDAALSARAVHRPGLGNRPLTGGRSGTLKKAEAMATGGLPSLAEVSERLEGEVTAVVHPAAPAEVQRSQMPPMPADYAHGLEPLDAMTAGLGRTQRNLLIQWGSILVGGIAIIVLAIMFFTS